MLGVRFSCASQMAQPPCAPAQRAPTADAAAVGIVLVATFHCSSTPFHRTNTAGQLGIGSPNDNWDYYYGGYGDSFTTPTPVTGEHTRFASLCAGFSHTCGVLADSRKIACWGEPFWFACRQEIKRAPCRGERGTYTTEHTCSCLACVEDRGLG